MRTCRRKPRVNSTTLRKKNIGSTDSIFFPERIRLKTQFQDRFAEAVDAADADARFPLLSPPRFARRAMI